MYYRPPYRYHYHMCRIALCSAGLLLCGRAKGQQVFRDSSRHLQGVEVTSRLADTSLRATMPVQLLDKQQLTQLNSLSVADAAKHFSGVIVRDYGGLGGLKTVSVRSLGANHTGVIYDGMAISDIQSGQIDLGKYSADNLAQMALYNAQPTDLLSPARNYSYGAALVLTTASLAPDGRQPLQVQTRIKSGSFGYINPALTVHYKASKRYTASFNADYRSTKGNYPFITDNGIATEKQRRENAGLRSLRLEQDNRFAWSNASTLQVKVYYYDDSQQLPGADILYSPPSRDHLWNRQAFVQSTYYKPFRENWQLKLNGKFSYTHTRYLDPGLGNGAGLQDNHYNSYEGYFSAVLERSLGKHFILAYASDGLYDKLNANVKAYAFPERFTFLNAFTARYRSQALEVQGNILSNILNESVQTGSTAQHHNLLTPALSLSWKPFSGNDLRLRAFYKQIFRAPTFDELYYSTFGNPTLKPEYATQYNLGATWQRSFSQVLSLLSLSADGYYNEVKNKIITLPGKNAYAYSVLNFGQVHITGVDVNAQLSLQPWQGWVFSAAANYTYQQVLDVTQPGTPQYKDQLPYTPRNTGGLMAGVEKKGFTFNYNLLYAGYRYALGDNTPSNYMEGFAVHDLNAAYHFLEHWKVMAALDNFTNKRYAIIRNFPMPGRSYQLGIQWNY
ncbi:TonB-dependent receptor [Chitinophaga costaii]|nr:TonB-dependent receptor [Chitinophaga costaii]